MNTSRTSHFLRLPLFAAMVVLLALGAGACGRKTNNGNGAKGGDAGSPVPGDWLIIHSLSDPEDLNLLTSTDAGAQEIHNLMYETLSQTDWETIETIPLLADSLPRMSEDRLSYEVSIRKDAKFADGKPITAADFIFYLKALKNPYVVNAAPTRGYYARVDRAEMIDNDPHRLRVVMSEPYYLGDQWVGGLYALPKHIWDPNGLTDKITFDELNQNDPNKNPAVKEFADWFQDPEKGRSKKFLIGSGPYVFEQWRRNDMVEVVRNENYWNKKDPKYGRAYPDRIRWKTVNDMNAALASLKSGNIDFMPNIEKLQYKNVRNNLGSFKLDSAVYPYPAYTYIGYNQDKPIFKDKLVRQALAHALNREAIIKTIYFNYAQPVQSPILRRRPESDTTIPIIPYDLNKAKALLTQAGWSDSDGDGILDKVINGRKTPFTFQILLNSGNERRKSMGLIFGQELKKIGINATTQSIDWALFLDRTRDGDYDAYIGGWVSGVTEGDMYQIWHSASAARGGSNYVRFRNARVDELIEQIRGEFDFEKRKVLYREIQKIIHDEQPYNFLVAERLTGAYNNRFENVTFYDPRPSYVPQWWWVPQSAQKYTQGNKATAMR
jgi:peptide/nickel transport system substrate-binding protein